MPTSPKRQRHSPEDVSAALKVLVYYGGNTARAEEATGIPAKTLRHWRLYSHNERYSEICEQEGPKLEALAAEQARESILRAGETERRIYDKLHDEFEDLKPKDLQELAGSLQRITTSKGINGTKLLELTGRPTVVTEVRDGAAILRELKQRVPGLIVDSTAEEITPSALPLSAEISPSNAREPSS